MSTCMESRHLVETENVYITPTSGSLHAVFNRYGDRIRLLGITGFNMHRSVHI